MKTILFFLCLLLLVSPSKAERSALDVYAAAFGGEVYATSETLSRTFKVKKARFDTKLGDTSVAELRRLARSKAIKYGLPPTLFEAVIQAESNFDKRCLGAAGEMSLGQIMVPTWAILVGKIPGAAPEPWRPEDNLEGAAIYMRDSFYSLTPAYLEYARRRGYLREHLVLALYNGGSGTVGRCVRTDRPLPPKIISYIRRVIRIHNSLQRRQERV